MAEATVFIIDLLMTFDEAISRLGVTIDRDDLEATYPDYINEALIDIADRHSFDQMKREGAVTIGAGTLSTLLPEGFKEFQNGRYPMALAGVLVPVYNRSELDGVIASFRPDPHLIFTQDDDASTISAPTTTPLDRDYTVYYFSYPGMLGSGGDDVDLDYIGQALLDKYPELVLEKAAEIGFKSINDPAFKMHEVNYATDLFALTRIDIRKSNPRKDEKKE